MAISDEMRRLDAKWRAGTGWPKRLEWIRIKGLRGWTGQRFEFSFPIMAIVGENGSGKSTVLQCAASVYKQPARSDRKDRFASDFFPDTAWDTVENAVIEYQVRQGTDTVSDSIRKPTNRWRGNPERPERHVDYVDLSRIQPISSRHGYTKLANPKLKEISAESFDRRDLARLGQIMGREYELAKMSLTNASGERQVLVLDHLGVPYSGFHGGAGETTISELLEVEMPDYGILIIDEIETSLHPRTQRRLMRDLATICRAQEVQIILSTHSPFILSELPAEARAFILLGIEDERRVVYGVSPEFAMTKMDDVPTPECDLYVEDERSRIMLTEILSAHAREIVQRCRIISYGSATVGRALGQMVVDNRFPVPSRVFLDGDAGSAPGCLNLPGEDAPERVVMQGLRERDWLNVHSRIGRSYAELVDACDRAMTLSDHHDWVKQAATHLVLGGDTLWQALCAEWSSECLDDENVEPIVQSVEDVLEGIPSVPSPVVREAQNEESGPEDEPTSPPPPSTNGLLPLFEQ